nr:glycosyltransferase family 2 protein [Pseudomonas sp.]
MTKQESSASTNNLVDAVWYLTGYPDIAAASQDPHQHYRLHGKAEGRLSYPLKAQQLDAHMWRGFADVAGAAQRELAANGKPLEAAHAAWQLAVWHTSQPNVDFPVQVLEQLLSAWQAGRLPTLAAGLMCIQGLLHHGRVQQAVQMLQQLLDRHGPVPDLCLMAANVDQVMGKPEDSSGLLPWVNRIFTASGLIPLERANPSLPPALGNLSCQAHGSANLGPQLTVIMPVFNGGAAMAYAIESVLAQTWRNLQLIVVDDCSTDDTFDRVRQIAARDQRVLPLRLESNQGAYAARNAGLQQATGQFITTHDSDDWSHPQKYELLIKTLLGKPELAGAMCHWVRCSNDLY